MRISTGIFAQVSCFLSCHPVVSGSYFRFTTYKATILSGGDRGTISYRVYKNKNALGVIDFPGYQAMTARGTCK